LSSKITCCRSEPCGAPLRRIPSLRWRIPSVLRRIASLRRIPALRGRVASLLRRRIASLRRRVTALLGRITSRSSGLVGRIQARVRRRSSRHVHPVGRRIVGEVVPRRRPSVVALRWWRVRRRRRCVPLGVGRHVRRRRIVVHASRSCNITPTGLITFEKR
jgi:hypothetical protein